MKYRTKRARALSANGNLALALAIPIGGFSVSASIGAAGIEEWTGLLLAAVTVLAMVAATCHLLARRFEAAAVRTVQVIDRMNRQNTAKRAARDRTEVYAA